MFCWLVRRYSTRPVAQLIAGIFYFDFKKSSLTTTTITLYMHLLLPAVYVHLMLNCRHVSVPGNFTKVGEQVKHFKVEGDA